MGRRQEGVEDGDEGKNQPGYSHSDVTSVNKASVKDIPAMSYGLARSH